MKTILLILGIIILTIIVIAGLFALTILGIGVYKFAKNDTEKEKQ